MSLQGSGKEKEQRERSIKLALFPEVKSSRVGRLVSLQRCDPHGPVGENSSHQAVSGMSLAARRHTTREQSYLKWVGKQSVHIFSTARRERRNLQGGEDDEPTGSKSYFWAKCT
jgi:hypothetical protein